MGVKSLSTFLRNNADKIGRVIKLPPLTGVASEMTQQRRNIIVDSHGFLMTFASEAMIRSTAQAIAVGEEPFPYAALAGGDLQCIRSAMVFMITRLRHVYGVELVFAVDAPVGVVHHDAINRGAVVAKRGAERDALLVEQLETCAKVATTNEATVDGIASTTAPPAAVMHVPLAAEHLLKQNNRPQMLVEQLYETLFQLRVTVKHLDDEVDRYIGALVHDYDPICVFTGDSDFVVTPGIPVVMDFDYPWDVMLKGWDASVRYSTMTNDALRNCIVDASRAEAEPLCLFLLESAALASFLNLSQDELLLAMSLCGNEITDEVVKEIGLTQIAGRGFRNYVIYAAALAKEILKHSVAPDDETKGLLPQLPFGITKGDLAPTLKYLKELLEKVIAAPLDPAARYVDISTDKWKEALNIFGSEWFTNWFLSHLRGKELNVPGKGRQIMIWKDLPTVAQQKPKKKKNKKATDATTTAGADSDVNAAAQSDPPPQGEEVPTEVGAQGQAPLPPTQVELVTVTVEIPVAQQMAMKVAETAVAADVDREVNGAPQSRDQPTQADELPNTAEVTAPLTLDSSATETEKSVAEIAVVGHAALPPSQILQTELIPNQEERVADLVLAIKGVVHALTVLASMSTDLIAVVQYMEDDDDSSSSGTEHNSNRSSDSTDSFVDEDPFLKSLEPFVPFEVLLSIRQYKLSSQRVPYTPLQFTEHPEERVLYDNLTSQRLPSQFLLIARSGRCNDHAIPVISGRFGFSLDLFTFYRLRQVIARRLGRVTIRVRNRQSVDIIKPRERRLSDAWLTATTAPVVPSDDIGSDQQIQTYRKVTITLPASVTAVVANSKRDVVTTISEIFDADKGILQCVAQPLSNDTECGLLSTMLLVMWVVHAGCTSFEEVRRFAEMMVLLYYSELGDEEMANAARSAVRGITYVNHAQDVSRIRGSPTRRTVELSRLFAAAFLEVQHVVKLLGIDNSVLRLPEPADVFSGSLLHDLMTLEAPLCLEILVRSVALSATARHTPSAPATSVTNAMGCIMSTITTLCNQFQSGFKTFQYRQADHYVTLTAASAPRMETPDEAMDSLESGGQGTKHVRAQLPGAPSTSVTPSAGSAGPSATPPQRPTPTTGTTTLRPTSRTTTLPIEEHAAELLRQVAGNRVVFVKGDTGCGKSSMVPLYLHRDAVAQGRYSYIICTQPRRVAAIALAKRVAHLLSEEVGQTVGYRIGGGTKQERHGKTKILFVTTGYLLENLSHRHEGGLWSRATHIVLDEVHERSLESDMMMLVVRLLLQQEDDEGGVAPHRAKRLILMSATISMTLFQNYFSSLSYPTKSGPEQRAAQRTATIEPAVEQAAVNPVEDPLPQLEDSAVAQQDILPTDHAANNDRGVAPQLAVVDPSARREDPPLAAPSSVGVSANPPEIPVVTAGERPKKVSIYLLPTIISGVSRLYPTFPREALDTLAAYAARCDRAKSAAALQLSPKEVKSMCQLILIHAKPASCILVFLPGLKEIEDFFQAITDLGPSDSLSLRLLVLHSIISQDDQNQIFVPAGKNECKIILSTNIAETSITIKDVKVVVDLGFVRRVVYDTKKHAKTIRTEWCSVAACVQRGGRAGRVTDGMNLRFYTEHVYVKLMPVFDESVLFPLEASILKFRLHFAHLGAVEDLFAQLIEPPAERKMRQTLTRLVRFGALGPAPEYEVLDFGRIAADLPVDIKFSRAIVLASRYGLAGEMAVIAAGHMLTYSLYQQPRRSACKNDAQFQAWMMETFTSMHHFDGGRCNDPLQFLSIMEAALAVRDDQIRRTFCYRHKLEFRQVTSLIDTTRLICTRIRESTAMAQLNFTANDIALMDALRSPTTTQRVRFASLAPQSRTVDHLLIVLTACADSVIGGVRATPSMHEILAGPDSFLNNTNRNTALSWAQSTKNDVIIFSEISRPVYDAGEAGFLECLRCFGASAIVFLAKGHGVYGAAVQMPRLADTHSATGSSAAPMTSPGVNAICRMKLLHNNGNWSFSSRHFEGLLVLQPKTSNMVQTLWRSMTLATECRRDAGHEEAEEEEVNVLTNDEAFHWTRRLRIDKWSSVGSHFIGSQFSSPALLGVAFTHNYLGGVPVATCNFLFSTQRSIKVLSFLAALVHLPPTWTVTLAKGRGNSGVSIIKLFSEDVHVNDVLCLLTPPISPILLLELNLHRLTLHMLTDVFARSPADYQHLCEVRDLLRTLREEGETKFVAMAGKETPDHHRKWDVELTSQVVGAPAQVESGHDVLTFVNIDPIVVDAALAACPRWRRAVEAYRQCMNLLETTDGVYVTLAQLPQCDSVPSPSDDPNERPIAAVENGEKNSIQ